MKKYKEKVKLPQKVLPEKKTLTKTYDEILDTSGSEDIDLTEELHPISYYIDDRVEMLDQAFSTISNKKLQAMVPPILKEIPMEELKALCLNELLGMSSQRILRVLEGRQLETSSDSDASSSDRDSEDISGPRKTWIKNEAKDVNQKVGKSKAGTKKATDTFEVGIGSRGMGEMLADVPKKKDANMKRMSLEEENGHSSKKVKVEAKKKSSHDKKPVKHTKVAPSVSKDGSNFMSNATLSSGLLNNSDVCLALNIDANKGKTLLEILELEMKACAIRALLKEQAGSLEEEAPDRSPSRSDSSSDHGSDRRADVDEKPMKAEEPEPSTTKSDKQVTKLAASEDVKSRKIQVTSSNTKAKEVDGTITFNTRRKLKRDCLRKPIIQPVETKLPDSSNTPSNLNTNKVNVTSSVTKAMLSKPGSNNLATPSVCSSIVSLHTVKKPDKGESETLQVSPSENNKGSTKKCHVATESYHVDPNNEVLIIDNSSCEEEESSNDEGGEKHQNRSDISSNEGNSIHQGNSRKSIEALSPLKAVTVTVKQSRTGSDSELSARRVVIVSNDQTKTPKASSKTLEKTKTPDFLEDISEDDIGSQEKLATTDCLDELSEDDIKAQPTKLDNRMESDGAPQKVKLEPVCLEEVSEEDNIPQEELISPAGLEVISEDNNIGSGPLKEVGAPLERSWTDRWLLSKDVQKVVSTSKICTRIRKRMKHARVVKPVVEEEAPLATDNQTAILEGSVDEYKNLPELKKPTLDSEGK